MAKTPDPNQQNQTVQQTLSTMPQMGSAGGGISLPSTYNLQPRKTAGVAEGVTAPTTEEYNPKGYTGQKLVDNKGIISRDQYAITDQEAYGALVSEFQTPAERRVFLTQLQALGLYGKSSPSITGTQNKDFNAVQQVMMYANEKGYTLPVAVQMMAVDPQIRAAIKTAGVSSKKFRPTPKQDLRAVFKQAAGSILGRQLSDAEIEKFVKSYTGMEKTEFAGGAQAPNVSVAAETAVLKAAPQEATAVGMSKLAEIMDQKIKALG